MSLWCAWSEGPPVKVRSRATARTICETSSIEHRLGFSGSIRHLLAKRGRQHCSAFYVNSKYQPQGVEKLAVVVAGTVAERLPGELERTFQKRNRREIENRKSAPSSFRRYLCPVCSKPAHPAHLDSSLQVPDGVSPPLGTEIFPLVFANEESATRALL